MRKLTLVATLIAVSSLLLQTACTKKDVFVSTPEVGGEGEGGGKKQNGGQQRDPNAPLECGQFGIQNFRAIRSDFEAITGISARDRDVAEVFQDGLTRLATRKNNVTQVTSAHTSTIFDYAGVNCEEALANGTSRIRLYGNVNRNNSPNSFSQDDRRAIISRLYEAFLARSPKSEEMTLILELMDEIVQENSNGQSNRQRTENMLIGTCIAVAASLEKWSL